MKLPDYNQFKQKIKVQDSIIQIFTKGSTAQDWKKMLSNFIDSFPNTYWTMNNQKVNSAPQIDEICSSVVSRNLYGVHYAIRSKEKDFFISGHFFAGESLVFDVKTTEITEKTYETLIGFICTLHQDSGRPIKVQYSANEEEYGDIASDMVLLYGKWKINKIIVNRVKSILNNWGQSQVVR